MLVLAQILTTISTGEGAPMEDGAIEPSKPASEVRQNAYPLPKEFEWSVVDVTNDAEVINNFPSCHIPGIGYSYVQESNITLV